jgi:trimeric autotransporter adhesin
MKNIIATLLVVVCFALPATLWAQLSPPPDGGYPGFNTAEGDDALYSLTTGYYDTAIGNDALYSNTEGYGNTAIGQAALGNNTTGLVNTANGWDALLSNTTGSANTATGQAALYSNMSADRNTADGYFALSTNTTGYRNTATGRGALLSNETGNYNTADGHDALFDNTGSFNTALGFNAGISHATGDNNIYVGQAGVPNEANTIRIGTPSTVTDEAGVVHAAHRSTYMAGIMGKTVPRSTPVFVNADGLLGTVTSSARFKDEIKPMDKASEAILALKPVTFRYKTNIDPDRTPQFGLVAEDVACVNPDLVVRDPTGQPYTVRYEAVNAMLLNEFLKEHATVQELKHQVAELRATVKQQSADIQKVSAQLVLSSAPLMSSNK